MNIAYVANARIPTEKAHGYQTVRVCSELAKLGHQVVLYVPGRKNIITEDPFAYYGIEKNFPIIQAPCFDWVRFAKVLGPFAFKLQMRAFLRALMLPAGAVVYTRDAEAVAHLSKKGYRCIYNAHNWASSRAALLQAARGVVCNSKGTEAAIKKDLSLPTVVAYNASDPNPFAGADKKELRKELGLPEDAAIALYAGHLYGWKGTPVLVDAAREESTITFVVLGGTTEDLERVKKDTSNIKNLLLLGHKPKADVPKYLAAADVLLLPNTAATEESRNYTSPIKLFEYMASGTPIVASDLPSLREVLTDDTALFVPAGDARALADTVNKMVSQPEQAQRRASKSLEESKKHTWGTHASQVAAFIGPLQ